MSTIRHLPTLVRNKFKSAKEAGDLTFYATQVSILECAGVPFQLRFSPALANKPKAKKAPNTKPFDPFENPSRLLISEWPPFHNLVLNKFPINENHFILSTKEFKEQTHLLEVDDLEAACGCVQAYKDHGEELFAFFNSGEFSGASQPHRHIQFLPLESMRQGIDASEKWSVLADQLIKEPRTILPFLYFSSEIPPSPSPLQLHEIYTSLYSRAIQEVQHSSTRDGEVFPVLPPNESAISYNLALTDRVMVLCPRQAEGIKITAVNGDEVGPVALNGTLLGGTLLVKSEAEWDALRNDASKLTAILQSIGVPVDPSQHEDNL